MDAKLVARQQKKALKKWESFGIGKLLLSLGEDLCRHGLQDTPERMYKAWKEHLTGYTIDPDIILDVTWEAEGGGDILVRDIFFTSLCEHHCLNFFGYVDVAYRIVPDGRVVGLSKVPRLVHCFAQRLQIQERLINQIAQALYDKMGPEAVVVRARAQHLCCTGRGVKAETMKMESYASRGDEKACRELTNIIKNNGEGK